MSITTSITVSKVTINLHKHDHKQIETVHALKIVLQSTGYYKTEYIGTSIY